MFHLRRLQLFALVAICCSLMTNGCCRHHFQGYQVISPSLEPFSENVGNGVPIATNRLLTTGHQIEKSEGTLAIGRNGTH